MRNLLLFLIFAVLTGCAGTGSLQHTLEARKGTLLYVHDSEKIADKKAGSLTIGSFTVEDVLAPETVVTRKSSFFLPLLFFNMWKQEDQAQLGYSQLENDYKQFLRDSLIEEMKRSSLYEFRDELGDCTLKVNIKKIEMSAPINQYGNFIFAVFFFAFGTQTTAGPIDVAVAADVQASKGETILLAKELKGHFRTNILAGKNANLKDYTTAMIEGVSMAVKDLNEKIVMELNSL